MPCSTEKLDWLIVGGGFHGTHLSLRLVTSGAKSSRVRVLDPHPEALWMWNHCTGNTGMKFLRSPVVHHLGLEPMELKRLMGKKLKKRQSTQKSFQGRYLKPRYELFQRHCQHVIHDNNLEELRLQGRALDLRSIDTGWKVETDMGTVTASRVVLALGLSEQPRWPDWAQPFRYEGSYIHHVFDPAFRIERIPTSSRVAVVGGGITAAQVAIRLAKSNASPVSLISRNAPSCFEFDSNPCFIGDKCMRDFRKQQCPRARREIIQQARHPGSLTPEVRSELQSFVNDGRVLHRIAEISKAHQPQEVAEITLNTKGDEFSQSVDHVVLCTGFEQGMPGGGFLQHAVENKVLPTAPCGYPLIPSSLEWGKNLFVMGPLAELEMGPTSRNITGARQAAERIVSHL